tara:strand:- start:36770 stop:36901 length:132 start_codon:yes stop_codon:yes gene_type:complete
MFILTPFPPKPTQASAPYAQAIWPLQAFAGAEQAYCGYRSQIR